MTEILFKLKKLLITLFQNIKGIRFF